MNVEKKDIGKSQLELTVTIPADEFEAYMKKGAEEVAKETKIEGFRPGKAPLEIVRRKVGEMTIMETAARIAVDKTIGKVFAEHVSGQPVGQPQVDILKLAPDNPFEYKIVVALLPKIELCDYKDVPVKLVEAAVSAEDVDKTILNLQEFRAKEVLSDSPVKEGDKVVLDISMSLDNVPLEGGQSKDAAVVVGKNYIIPGFDKNITGLKKGEEKKFMLPYPKDHHMKNIAGKMVDFKVVVKDVFNREMPALDDQLALGFGFKSYAEMRTDVEKSIRQQKEDELKQSAEKEMLLKIIDQSKFGDLPEVLVDHEAKSMMSELENSVQSQGGKFDDYLTSVKKTRDQMMLDFLPEAVKRVKVSVMLKEVADKEAIKVSDEDVDKQIKSMRERYKNEKGVLERIETQEYRQYLRNMLASRKTIERLLEWNLKK
jgi:trigger factor